MLDTRIQPIIDLYPIVVDLDDEILDNGISNNPNPATKGSMYDVVASEASWLVSERSERSSTSSWMLDSQDDVEPEIPVVTREKESTEAGSPRRRRRKFGSGSFHSRSPPSPPSLRRTVSYGPIHRHDDDDEDGWNGNDPKNNDTTHDDCSDDDCESIASGRVFANVRSFLRLGSQRYHSNNTSNNNNSNSNHKHKNGSIDDANSRNLAPDDIPFSSISQAPSPIRLGRKRNRSRRFHDEYVLTQQIARCRVATLWECVHRPTGRRYCAKAIDKRRFASLSDRAMAVREIAMHRSTQLSSPASCLPRVRDIFADEEAAEPIPQQQHHQQQQHDYECCKSSASCGSESTMSISSHSGGEDSNHTNNNNNYWYIVQDFEAGGGNLGLYLLGRENATSIFHLPGNGMDNRGGNEMDTTDVDNIHDDLYALEEASRTAPKTLQESEIRALARSLLLAVNELHRRFICHNDLCLENILVPLSVTESKSKSKSSDSEGKKRRNQRSEERERERECSPHSYRHNRHRRSQSRQETTDDVWKALKLCDLGRAFVVDEAVANDGDAIGSSDPRHGSIYYTSPEVLLGKPADLASDMWSVGVILYRCFAGELPFKEQSEDNSCHGFSSTPMSPTSSSNTGSTINSIKREKELKREICKARCKFGYSRSRRNTDLRWSRVSRGAKQFLSALLNSSPTARMTCEEALHHPWLTNATTTANAMAMAVITAPSLVSSNPLVSCSSSSPLAMMPIVPSSTSTNHYRHHPQYSAATETTAEKMDTDQHDHPRDEGANGELECSPTTSSSATHLHSTPSIDHAIPKSFVHKFFHRFKNSN